MYELQAGMHAWQVIALSISAHHVHVIQLDPAVNGLSRPDEHRLTL